MVLAMSYYLMGVLAATTLDQTRVEVYFNLDMWPEYTALQFIDGFWDYTVRAIQQVK